MIGSDFFSKLDDLDIPESNRKLRSLSSIFGVNIATLSKYKNEPNTKLQRFTARQLAFFGKMDQNLRTYIMNKRINESDLCVQHALKADDVLALRNKLIGYGMSQNGFFNLFGISSSSYQHIEKTKVVRLGLAYTFELIKAFDLTELFDLMLKYEVSERAIERLNKNFKAVTSNEN